LFTGCFGDQKTTVTRGTVVESAFMLVGRIVLGTDRIVGTQLSQFQSVADVLMNSTTDLDEAA
jgi:hypothetical protein